MKNNFRKTEVLILIVLLLALLSFAVIRRTMPAEEKQTCETEQKSCNGCPNAKKCNL